MGVSNESDAERVIGILLHPGDDAQDASSSQGRRGRNVVAHPHPHASGLGGPSRKDKRKDREPNGSRGRKLAEVFSIQLDNGRELRGKLHVTDGLCDESFDLHFPDRSNLPSNEGYKAKLSGLHRSIMASDDIVAELDLWDDTGTLSEELINWSRYRFFSWDQVQSSSLRCRFGTVTSRYVFMKNAAEGRIEIVLNGTSPHAANVYGSITARISSFDETIQLFDKGAFEYVTTNPQHPILLLRSVVSVPVDSTLVIEADIWDCKPNSATHSTRHDGIGQGTAEFEPDIFTASEMPIEGYSGEIAVRVNWM